MHSEKVKTFSEWLPEWPDGKADVYPVLKGEFAGLRKLRAGDYRVIYAIMESDCLILCIGHRREICRSSPLGE